jgi:hypothetical protein
MVTNSITVPHANFKIDQSGYDNESEILERIDLSLVSLGFILQENDWKVWEPILEQERLAEKKQERRYKKEEFEVFYGVLYKAENKDHIRLSFYEHDQRQFSIEGIELYYKLKDEFTKKGLVHLTETPEDVKTSNPIKSPEEFNSQNPLPPTSENVKYAAFMGLSCLIYLAIVLVPGWLLIRKWVSKLSVNYNTKRCIFVFLAALTLFPAPIPMSMFGPVLLIPGILTLPFMIEFPLQLISFMGVSFGITFIVSLIAALWIFKPCPNKALNKTP